MNRSSSSSSLLGAATVTAVLVVGLASPAFAQGSDNNVRAADAAFVEGRAALAKGDLERACTKLAESDRIAPSGRAALNLADCFERRGLLASAYTKFLDAASRAVQASRPDAERHARERAARLEPRLGRMSISVPKESVLPGLEIRKDGELLSQHLWDGENEVADPGTAHTYEANVPGRPAWKATVVIEEGRTAHVELRWPAASSSSSLSTRRTNDALQNGPTSSSTNGTAATTRTLAFGSLGVGAAGIIVGVIGGLQVLSAKATVEEHCSPVLAGAVARVCDREGVDAGSRGRTWSVASPIAFGVGAIGVGLGTFFLLQKRDRPGHVAVVSPFASPTSAGLSLGGNL